MKFDLFIIVKKLKYLILVYAVFSCSEANQQETNFEVNLLDQLNKRVPFKEDVGASALPEEIAPVHAPFEMPEFNKPVFPERVMSIIEHGAKENVLSTRAIQETIEEVHRQGGGTVLVPKGIWKTGRIVLKSNVNFHLEEGAALYFSGEVEDYQPAVFTRHEGIEVYSLGACIYAYQQENIAITGKGILYGPGDGSVKDQMMTQDVVENVVPYNKPVTERVYEGHNGDFIFLPMFISPTECKNVYIEGITLEQTAFWNIVPVYCDGVIIRGVTINSIGIPRGDGIDIESSRNVLIEYSTLNNGDDCFTMKSGRAEDGLRVNRPTENVVVRYCLAKQGHGGITVGSETAGMIRNLYVHDCVFDDTGVGIRFKTRRPRGGGGENLYYERIRMTLRNAAFNWDMLGSRTYVGELADRLPMREVNALTPKYANIVARDIVVEEASDFIKLVGIPESLMSGLTIENAYINSQGLIYAKDAKDISLKNMVIQSQDSLIEFTDCKNIAFEDVHFKAQDNKLTVRVLGGFSETIRFINCTPDKPDGWEKNSWTDKKVQQ